MKKSLKRRNPQAEALMLRQMAGLIFVMLAFRKMLRSSN